MKSWELHFISLWHFCGGKGDKSQHESIARAHLVSLRKLIYLNWHKKYVFPNTRILN